MEYEPSLSPCMHENPGPGLAPPVRCQDGAALLRAPRRAQGAHAATPEPDESERCSVDTSSMASRSRARVSCRLAPASKKTRFETFHCKLSQTHPDTCSLISDHGANMRNSMTKFDININFQHPITIQDSI